MHALDWMSLFFLIGLGTEAQHLTVYGQRCL